MSLQLYYDHTQLSNPEPASQFSPAGTLKDRLDTYDIDFEHHLALGPRNQLVWGLGYRFTHDVVGNSRPIAFLPSHLDHSLVSGFVQDEIAMRKDLFLTLGTKIEHNDYTGYEFEPTARLRWIITPTQVVWGAVSRAVRMPSRVDRDLAQPSEFPIILVGSDDFDSETLIAYELGYRFDVSSRFTALISAFYNDYDHLRSLSFTPATVIPFFFANDLQGETHGIELSATYQATQLVAPSRGDGCAQGAAARAAGKERHQSRTERNGRPRAAALAPLVVRPAASRRARRRSSLGRQDLQQQRRRARDGAELYRHGFSAWLVADGAGRLVDRRAERAPRSSSRSSVCQTRRGRTFVARCTAR